MTDSHEKIKTIVSNALWIFERLRIQADHPDQNQEPDPEMEKRWDRWKKAVADDDAVRIEQRLRISATSQEELKRGCTLNPILSVSPLPTWAIYLASAIQDYRHPQVDRHIQEGSVLLDAQAPLPFETLYLPLVGTADRYLKERLGNQVTGMATSGYTALKRLLLVKLAGLCQKLLFDEFIGFRVPHQCAMLLFDVEEEIPDPPPNTLHTAFITQMIAGGFEELLLQYSALARLISVQMVFWVEACAEMIARFERDEALLRQHFNGGDRPMVVTHVSFQGADAHNHGRQVAELFFANGQSVMYKPRSLGPEKGYNRLLQWMNHHGFPLPFKIVTVLDREDYGWMEVVKQKSCQNNEEAQRYYARMGAISALFYPLGGYDAHFENFIPHGEHPVFIDNETLLLPETKFEDYLGDSAYIPDNIEKRLLDSVWQPMILPSWRIREGTSAVQDISALRDMGDGEDLLELEKFTWVHSDYMKMERKAAPPLRSSKNHPYLRDTPLSVKPYINDFIHGFETMFRWLMQHRSDLLAADSPLMALGRSPMRYILRPTSQYILALHRIVTPKYLESGVDVSIELEYLSRRFLGKTFHLADGPIWQNELEALTRFDIPVFFGDPLSGDLILENGERIPRFFFKSGLSKTIDKLTQMDASTFQEQLRIIHSAFFIKYLRTTPEFPTPIAQRYGTPHSPPPDHRELISQAKTIGETLREHAIYDPEEGVRWLSFGYSMETDRYYLQPSSFNLYEGAIGIGLFFAALTRVTGDEAHRKFLELVIQPLRKKMGYSEFRTQFQAKLTIGGTSGLGSIVYGLSAIGALVEDQRYIAMAADFAELITPDKIVEDPYYDLISGAAGALLGLLRLHRETGDVRHFEGALACGQHLLKSRVETPSGHRVWKTNPFSWLAGAAHGQAGIAYSLIRLYSRTGDGRFLDAAHNASLFEETLFDPRAHNWPVLLPRKEAPNPDKPFFKTQWCHGAPGIAVSNLGSARFLPDNSEIYHFYVNSGRKALATTVDFGVREMDNLCCGNAGRMETLLVGKEYLGAHGSANLGKNMAGLILDRAQTLNGLQLFMDLPSSLCVPGLFQGSAGIGYQLLRLAHPELLHSILLWD
ncbi:MAG: type 2 lantipeptide synthetase LanM family protein [Magnetococcales bacterium]|nr:type 2 lantipeptide synthetase LanM family protein [Magnetococcales bacterium]